MYICINTKKPKNQKTKKPKNQKTKKPKNQKTKKPKNQKTKKPKNKINKITKSCAIRKHTNHFTVRVIFMHIPISTSTISPFLQHGRQFRFNHIAIGL